MANLMIRVLLLSVLLAACTNAPYRGDDVLGADEFVMDSYRIREGKFAILEMEGKSFAPLEPELLCEYPDLIHDGDVLQVALYHPTRGDLVGAVQSIGSAVGYRVAEGKIHLPDLEPVEIGNLSLEEAGKRLGEKYREQMKDVDVFLSYRERIQRKVELIGHVQIPNIPVDGRIRLFETLSVAKIPAQANLFKSYVIRSNQLLPVDLYKLIKEGDMRQNIVMRGGDKIYIADSAESTIMVLGEVGRERVVDVPNGFLTLRQAIAEAGGIPFSGDRAYIQIIRGNILHPKIYSLNWEHVVRLPGESLLLMPGDIVYVAATPMTQWNRFVSQILPTLIGLDLITKGVKGIGVNVL